MTILTAWLVLGVLSMRRMAVSLLPEIDIPQIMVQVSSPGTPAETLYETVMEPLRNQLIQISEHADLEADVRNGSGVITLTADLGTDADLLFIEVSEKVDRAVALFPAGTERPRVSRSSFTDIPAFFVNVTTADTSEAAFVQTSSLVQQVVSRRLEQLPQVAMVDCGGLASPVLRITPDAGKMEALGISTPQLASALADADLQLGAVRVRDGMLHYDIRMESRLMNRHDIEAVCLTVNGRIYRMGDIAGVSECALSAGGLISSDGRRACSMAIIKRKESRMHELKKQVDKLLKALHEDYPALIFTITRDQTTLLEESLDSMVKNLVWGMLLACAVLFIFMRDLLRPLLVALTIPVALVLSFPVLRLLGIGINIISLSGLILGIGMLVDNAIITADNIARNHRTGMPCSDACVRGAREVFSPMLGSVLTTCAIFVPLIFLSGLAGALFYDQAMTVTVTLFAALAVSVLVLPVAYRMLRRERSGQIPDRTDGPSAMESRLQKCYHAILKRCFRHRKVIWILLGVAVPGSALLFSQMDKQRMPSISHHEILLKIIWDENITTEENERRCQKLIQALPLKPLQQTVMAGVQQFLLPHTQVRSGQEALIFLAAGNPKDVGRMVQAAAGYLRSSHPRAICTARTSGNVFDMLFADKEAMLTIRLRADDMAVTPEETYGMLQQMAGAMPCRTSLSSGQEEYLELIPRTDMMALYHVTSDALLHAVRRSLGQETVFRITQGNRTLPVVMDEVEHGRGWSLQQQSVQSDGIRIPMSVLLKETLRMQQQRITADLGGVYSSLSVDAEQQQVPGCMEAARHAVSKDNRFRIDFSGNYFSGRGTVKELTLILCIAVLLLYFILAAQEESLLQPLIILSELIIDIFLALGVLYISGETLNIMSMTGLVVMCGIVINDSILKIDTINQLRRSGMELKRAIFTAGEWRLNAILMTSLTTILAIAPFLFRGDMGSDLQYPFSFTLIWGMGAGTLVSLFVVPVIYYACYRHDTA